MVDEFEAAAVAVCDESDKAWAPPPKLTLSEWADEYFYLSAATAAQPGKWTTLPYQREIMDAITDPRVEQVTLMKSARIGYTLMVGAAEGYFIDQDPSAVMVVQPTVDDGKNYSKESIAPMLRDVPRLAAIAYDETETADSRDSGNTIQHKNFANGALLDVVGANSGAGFRRKSRRVVIFDEVDAYPPSAGSEGDPVKLGMRRSAYFWNRKHILGSTPLIAKSSRIERAFTEGDQRRYYVPCPQCGHMDILRFREPDLTKDEHGHWMQWPENDPAGAHFVCFQNGCVIEHSEKREMVERGEWRASAPFTNHASFHIWAAYSYSPDAEWGKIAAEFLVAKKNVEELKTFVNTVLGETWTEKGEAPEWQRLYHRREKYQIGTIPDGVRLLTCGVDVQKDRWVYEVVGWAATKESWSVETGVIPGDTSNETDWLKLDELLSRTWKTGLGVGVGLRMLAIDSGFNTQMVYNWARKRLGRVIAIKGQSAARTLINSPTAVDVTIGGKRIARGCKVWPVGVDIAKSELYGWLRLDQPIGDAAFPSGFCHFPEYGEDYFKQLTAEHLVSKVNVRTKFVTHEWQLIPGRENHYLDARVYARAAAAVCQVDRMRQPATPTTAAPAVPAPTVVPTAGAPRKPQKPKKSGGWITGGDRFLSKRYKD